MFIVSSPSDVNVLTNSYGNPETVEPVLSFRYRPVFVSRKYRFASN